MKKYFFLLMSLSLLTNLCFGHGVEMADGLRSEGKIYVVVIVVAIITLGLFGYLFYLDKKLSKQEKKDQ